MLSEEDLLTEPPPSPDASGATRRPDDSEFSAHVGASHVARAATMAHEPPNAPAEVSQRERMAALSRPIVLSRTLAADASARQARPRAATMARPVSEPLMPPNRRKRLDGMALLSALLVLALLLTSAGIAYTLLAQHGVALPLLPHATGHATPASTTPRAQGFVATTATPNANGKAGVVTVTFSPATRSFTSPGAMTACPGGCDLTASLGSAQHTVTISMTATGQYAYYAVDLQMIAPDGYSGLVTPVGADGNTCANGPFRLTLNAGQSRWIQCQPAHQPVAPDDFYNETYTPVFYQNPKGSYLDTGSHFVTGSDCAKALGAAGGQAQSWGQGYAPAGQQVVARSIQMNGTWCTPGVSHAATTFTGNAAITVNYESFAPSDARALASQRLNTLLPAGYAWKQGSVSACTPTWSTPTNATTFTVTCAESGMAVAQWTDTQKAQLAAALAGHTMKDALAACNAFAGVQPGSCHITFNGSATASLPASASAITIAPVAPQ